MTTGPETPQPQEPERPAGQQPGPPPDYAQQGPPQPGYGQQQTPPAGYGQAPPPGYAPRPPMRPEDEKLWAIGAHLGPLVLGVIAPLVVWLVFKDRSRFLDRSAKEALNMQLSYLVYFIVAGFSVFLLIGLLLLPVVGVAWLVLMIIATIKVSDFEDYRYPLIFRLVS
jgi:uncharacterized protein